MRVYNIKESIKGKTKSDGFMAKIIYEDKGPNYQVPGLPYEESFKYVKSVILDEVPIKKDIEEILATADKETLANSWSLYVVKGFKDYIPTTFRRITQHMPQEMLEKYFHIKQEWIPEHAKVLLQLQTELDAKTATLDAAIIHHRRDLGTVVNKAHIMNRLYSIGRLYGHLEERKDFPFLFGDLTVEQNWDEALSRMKLQSIDYIMEVPVGKRNYPTRTRTVDVSRREIENKYVYLEWLKQKLGDNLTGVLLYGSAARTDNPEEYSDFDNWIRVRDVAKAHQVLRGTAPAVFDGKVVECRGKEYPEGAKHLGIHLFPESEDYAFRFIRFLHDSREFLKHTKVLYGEFPFIKVSQDEVVERGISQAYVKLKTVAGSLNWAYSTPEKIIGKPSLFEFIVKNVRFFLQHELNALEEPKFRSKQELDELLKQKGMSIPKYSDEPEKIKKALIFAMISVLALQKELLESGRKPRLRFLVDDKTYEWTSEEIDDWSRFDE